MPSLTERLAGIQRGLAATQAIQPTIIEFGGWMPDRADLGNPGTTVAKNVRPVVDGFAPLENFGTAKSDALTARAQGIYYAITAGGVAYIYAGDKTSLYELYNSTWTDRSKSGGYTTPDDGAWRFARYSQNFFCATNGNDPVQFIAVGGTTFADLITSSNKPKGYHVAALRNFLVLGNTTDGAVPNRVWWSALGDPQDFTPSASTQSDYNDIEEGGRVQAIVPGAEYALVFLESQIVRMTYVGSPIIFRFDPVDRQRGTPIPNSVIALGRRVWFISEEGFFESDGVSSTPIGHEQVDREFWNNFDLTYRGRVSAAIDPVRKLVFWSFPTTGNTTPDKIFMFNWVTRQWSFADVTIDIIGSVVNQGLTLDGLDAISTDLDALPFSLDSQAYQGGDKRLGAIKTDFKLYEFDGSNLAGTIETAEFQPFNANRSIIDEFQVLMKANGSSPTVTGAIASRSSGLESVSFGSAGTMGSTDGRITQLSDSDYFHRIRLSIAAGGTWEVAQGLRIKATNTGQF